MRKFIVLKYAKYCGFKWLAKDKNGAIYGYYEKPIKNVETWRGEGGKIHTDLDFLSWEDEEPYEINISIL